MTWAWLALLGPGGVESDQGGRPPDLAAPAVDHAVGSDHRGGGQLVVWTAGRRPHREAVRVDAAVLDPAGAAARVVWQCFAVGAAPLFDDPAVQQLTRRLAGPDLGGLPPGAVSTFTRDPAHYAGGLSVHRDGRPLTVLTRDSWLRRIGPVQGLRVAAGLLGATAARPGPGTQRYAGQPWPATRFLP